MRENSSLYKENLKIVVDKNILSKFLHLIIQIYQVTDKNKFTLAIQDCLNRSTTDRFIMAVSTPSLDTSDTSTGFIGTERAIIETAYWIQQILKNMINVA